MSAEEWLPVVGYEGMYEVSSKGRVRSLPGSGRHGRMLRGNVDRWGYKRVALTKGRMAKAYMVHRLVAGAFLPVPGVGVEIHHKDFNPSNNAADNLMWATHHDNMRFSHEAGRRFGEKNGRAVLSDADVAYIRKYENFIPVDVFAQIYGVAWSTIGRIIRGNAWRRVATSQPNNP